MADDEDGKGYRWETEYERTWEAIKEDDSGLLQPSVQDYVHRTKRKQMLSKKNIRLGMMRHLYLIIDFSEAMAEPDLKPSRLVATLKMLELFVEEFFYQNPISNLGIISTFNKKAEKLAELAGNPQKMVEVLKSSTTKTPCGEPSLQNSLELASQVLKHLPSHTSREVLVILGSLTTCDPGDIYSTIEMVKKQNVRCSVIGLAAELRVCRALTKSTGGTYGVILDEPHFKDLLFQHVAPPPVIGNAESSLIRMGFPYHRSEGEGKPSMCFCHLESKNPSEGFGTGGYYCPQCNGKYCELPVECKACRLTLVSAPHLARSFHHLFALDPFEEVPQDQLSENTAVFCAACQNEIKDKHVYTCTKCQELFCLECDLFIHDTLHTCPGCASHKGTTVL
ncbi:general transcription factor IIH subunit 2-like [Ornithodoros turicata]|uniref:general transcription factor IIH subunit 2-like n=1 Tax=Ornithodoros turicata TaxID=34597 RepID=UPI003138DE69